MRFDFEGLLPWAAAGVGAWWLYSNYFGAGAATVAAASTAGGASPPTLSSTPGQNATAGNIPGAAPPDLGTRGAPAPGAAAAAGQAVQASQAQVLAAVKLRMGGAANRLNAWQWGWAYEQETGAAAPAPDYYLPDKPDGSPWLEAEIQNTLMTADQWWQMVIVPAGLGRMNSLGRSGGAQVVGSNYTVH